MGVANTVLPAFKDRGPFPVFMPYTIFHKPTWDCLYEAAGDFTPVRLDPDDHRSYLWYMMERWEAGTGFINIEHDVLPSPGCFPSMEVCPYPWCMFIEPGATTDQGTLSLVRFRAEFIAAHPDVWRDMEKAYRVRIFQPLWTMMDVWLFEEIPGEQHPHRVPYIRNTRVAHSSCA